MNKIPVMIDGLPGNVARIMAAAALKDERLSLIPCSLTGEVIEEKCVTIEGTEITLIKPSVRDSLIPEILEQNPGAVSVDYTHPTAVNANAEFYTQHGIPFVMGTTGGDRDALEAVVNLSDTPAVIAPNMAKQIVGLQAMLEFAAKTFPGLYRDYTLEVKESHQQGKADTSGTAKALVACFNDLGTGFDASDIQKIRDPEVQEKEWGIPREHLGGHGWHTYTLKADNGSSLFEFRHNINGRDIYVSGTFDAVVFLAGKMQQKDDGKRFYTMIDVMTQKG